MQMPGRRRSTVPEAAAVELLRTGLVTRRRFLRGALGAGASLSLAGLLAACGGDDDDDEESPTNTPSGGTDEPTATEAEAEEPTAQDDTTGNAGAFPVNIEHAFGSTTIDAAPERVVCVSWNGSDFALALGVTPVGVREWLGGYPFQSRPWAQEQLGGAELETVGGEELDVEQIAGLQPDLILGLYAHLTEEVYTTLSQIAPTVAHPSTDAEIPWQQQMLLTGRALGHEARAEEIVAGVEERYEQARSEHPEFDGMTAAFASFSPDGFWIFEAIDVRTQFLTSLGFQLPEETGRFSHERAEALDHDAVVAVVPSEQFESDPLYGELNIVAEERVIYLDDWSNDLAAAIGFNSPLSLRYLLDGIVPMLAAAVDGNPSTTTAMDDGDTGAANPFQVTIPHKFGEMVLEAEPERVLTIGFSEQDPVLALGVQPIAIREWFGEQPFAVWPWGQDALGDAEPEVLVMPFGELDFELIAGLQPDLIVATHAGILEEEYTTLAQIAPTLAQPGGYPDFGVPWQEQTRLIGMALGRAEEAEELISTVEDQTADSGAEHSEFGGATVAWITPADGGYWATGPTTPPMRFLADLGFRMPDDLSEAVGDADSIQISGEQLHLIDVDVLIALTDSEAIRDEIENDPLFQQLRVAQEGRIIFFEALDDPIYGALSFSTVLSLPYAVEHLTPRLVAAVDGDPDTEA